MSSAPDASNTADAAQQGLGGMTVRDAVFVGVGSMVGAGIRARGGSGQHRRSQVHRPSPVGHRGGPAGSIRDLHRCDTRPDQPTAASTVDLPPAVDVISNYLRRSGIHRQARRVRYVSAGLRPARQSRRDTWPGDLGPRRARPGLLCQPERNRLFGKRPRTGDLPHHLDRGLPPSSGDGVAGLGADHWHPAHSRGAPRVRGADATN
jgi:hypothetical protein